VSNTIFVWRQKRNEPSVSARKLREIMKIKLNEQYQVRGIPMNFILEEKKIRKEGKNIGEEYWQEIGYYPTLESLLRGIATRHLQTTETNGIELLISEIKTFTKSVKEQIEVLEG
jgi:hypothetical protein